MRKLQLVLFSALLILLGGSFISVLPVAKTVQAQAAAQCYYDNDGKVAKMPLCEKAGLEAFGMNTQGMPETLTGCYVWNDVVGTSGQAIDCNDPKITGAAASIGDITNPDPPPLSLQDVSSDQPNCYNPVSDGGYLRVQCSDVALFVYASSTNGKTFENGKCYLSTGDFSGSISVRDINCSTVKTAMDTADTVAAEADGLERGDGFVETECTESNDYSNCGIISFIYSVINFLSVGVGVIVVLSVVIGGLQYLTAGNNPQAVVQAKKRVFNAILALLAYTLLFTFLQWIVPGGLFN